MSVVHGTPFKCGILINPPCFVLIYKSKDKMKKKIMPLRSFKWDTNVKHAAEELTGRHDLDNVPLVKIKKMLRLLQELLKGSDKSKAVDLIDKEFTIKVNEDLNKLPTDEIEFQKQLMDAIFVKNHVKQNSQDFVYDKRIEFDNVKEESNWDEDEKDNFWD